MPQPFQPPTEQADFSAYDIGNSFASDYAPRQCVEPDIFRDGRSGGRSRGKVARGQFGLLRRRRQVLEKDH